MQPTSGCQGSPERLTLVVIKTRYLLTPEIILAKNEKNRKPFPFLGMNSKTSSSSGLKREHEPVDILSSSQQPTSAFVIPKHYACHVRSVLISRGQIQDRVEKLAADIRSSYAHTTVHLICVLKGGSAFFHDLQSAFRALHNASGDAHVPFTFDFIRAKSYSGTESTGKVEISACDLSKLKGRDVLLVEDIIDTGTTMSLLLPLLKEEGLPKSIAVASLLEKRREDKDVKFVADFVGFSVPDEFVVGYCLDYNDAFRDLQHICCISPEGIERFKDGI